MSDHDPFNEPDLAHPRSRELMRKGFFWDCVNELAPFGSDGGSDAYYEWRHWRSENPNSPPSACIAWIMNGQLSGYNDKLCSDEQISADLANPDDAYLADHYDMFTLDATVIASALGQLLDEGKIDPDAKQYARVAVKHQLHPDVCMDTEHREVLLATQRVIDAA
ncbi:MAG: molybdate metabolism regulator [Planctomycetota bacterium]